MYDELPTDIVAYHRRTRHAPMRYALGPAFLDWESQPNPFRRFAGARLVELPLVAESAEPKWGALTAPRLPEPMNARSLGRFFELALGISAWKTSGEATWALRNNPSSGNLHPTEAFTVLPPVAGIGERSALWHYAPREHGLEERCVYQTAPALPENGFLVGLSSVAWREAWKYGERAFRYVQLDTGHVIGCIAYAAAVLGWRARVLSGPSEDSLNRWLGLDRDDSDHKYETERAEPMIAISGGEGEGVFELPESPPPGEWLGTANRLSEDHDPWPAVDLAFRFTHKPATGPLNDFPVRGGRELPGLPPECTEVAAEAVIRSRRSAQRMDGQTGVSADTFLRVLGAAMPDAGAPHDAFPWAPRLALLVFVHRVEGVEPGLYALVRDIESLPRLRDAFDGECAWRPLAIAGDLPLYLLKEGVCQKLASQLSCLQAIGGKGAFAFAMMADFARTLAEEGDWAYRRLYWEAGLIGQALYLEATAAGVSGTGIGCYFDDAVKAAVGMGATGTEPGESLDWQPVYNFTIGGAVEDDRIAALPAYHRAREG